MTRKNCCLAVCILAVLSVGAMTNSAIAQHENEQAWKGRIDLASYSASDPQAQSQGYGQGNGQGYGQGNGQGYGQGGYDQGRPGYGYWISNSRPSQRDFGGGSGGRNVTDAKCGPGYVATGFHVKMGQYFNLVWVDCAGLRSNGSLDGNRIVTAKAGAQGGGDFRDAQCPYGQGLVGLRGSAAASIDEAAGRCANVKDIADRKGYPRIQFTNSITIPRPGGRPADAQCQSGQVMVGIRVKSGQWIDHLWILCSNIQKGR